MPSLAIKIGIVVAGLVFYFFAISALLNIRRDKSEQKVLFDAIDWNNDGVLTTPQINYFQPCPQSNRSKLVNRLNSLGPRVTLDQFQNDVNRNMIKYTIAPCAVNAHLFANPEQLSKRQAATTSNSFFMMYDLDQDGIIRWDEYSLVNKYHGRSIKGASDTFIYLDANNDWEISKAEFVKAKLENLDPRLPASARRKAPIPRHGHSAPTAPTVAGAGAATQRPQAYDPSTRTDPNYGRNQQPIDSYNNRRSPGYASGAAGDYDIVVDRNVPASVRIQRQRMLENQYRYREPIDSRYAEPVRAQRSRVNEPIYNDRLQSTGRLDTLTGQRARYVEPTAAQRTRYYEQGL